LATTNKNFKVKHGLDVNGEINISAAGGSEGGQLNLDKPASGTTLAGNVAIDVYENKLRIFEQGGTARGAYIDLTGTASSVGTNLIATSGAMNYAQQQSTKQSGISASGTTIISKSFTTNGYPVQVLVTGDAENSTAGGWVKLQLYRDSTAIGKVVHVEMSSGSENVPYALTVIDTPAAGTYVYALKTVSVVSTGTMNFGETDGPVLTLIELSGSKGADGAAGLSDIVSDTTPQLGGDLDTNGYDITGLNALTLDTTPTGVPTGAGVISWDTDFDTPAIQLNTAVTLQVGQEHLVRVKNNSNSVAIPNGAVVMFAGATGDTVKVSPAVSTSANEPYKLVGIATQEISADGFGFVTQFGFVNGLNTSSYSLGDLLYSNPSSPGELTATQPTAPNWTFPIAAVARVGSGSSGRILVRAIPGAHVHDLIDVTIDSPADNEILAWNSATSTWINQTAAEAGLLTAETDPVFTASAAHGISSTDIAHWNSAYGWGNHASAGYLTTLTGTLDGYAKYSIADIQQKTTSYTLVITDANDMIEVSSSSPTTITVPTNASVAFPTKTEIHILQTGSGQITIAGDTGVTVNGTPGLNLRAQWSMATLIKRDTNTWLLVGDLIG
jgi:hypothetical protein